MATNRGERMLERMRGAGRHEVADESFGFVMPAEESSEAAESESSPSQPSAPPSAIRSASNTSAKRRAVDDAAAIPDPEPVPEEELLQLQDRTGALNINPYEIPQDQSREEEEDAGEPAQESTAELEEEPVEEEPVAGSSPQLGQTDPSPITVFQNQENEDENEGNSVEELPKQVARPGSRDSMSSRISAGAHVSEEVTESPVGAPGSGHRRRVRMSNVVTQSAELQRMVIDQETAFSSEPGASSPLARKTRMSGVTPSAASARSRRTTRPSALAQSFGAAEVDELSPLPAQSRNNDNTMSSSSARSNQSSTRRTTTAPIQTEHDELSSPVPLVESRRRAQAKTRAKKSKQPSPDLATRKDEAASIEEAGKDASVEEDGAEQIEAEEAARVIGRKRPRTSPPREESPELDAQRDEPSPPPKRQRQKRAQQSPAVQSQPKAAVGRKFNSEKQKQKPKEKPSRKRHSGADEQVPIAVQRYTQRSQHNESDTDADILSADIPFANRSGVNVIDVLAQICEDVIDTNLAILHEAANNTVDAATRKEYRTKLRALEAFQQELGTRLLEHTIALDTLHALKKRVRSIQKEKLTLRNEIIRIRAEKEQVALKIDAVRVRHEKESKQSLDQLNLSATMHDIELVIDNGRQAPDLGPREQKTAELANLELIVSRVAGQVATESGVGNLKLIQEFNMFLERAAAALEAR
ncbi:hypothetical protein PFICI_13314 [Pestalotiopsis fici W106-1]|uniref:Inner kinetochore subunit AME1 domain-containing protein n=1 Tax=Pestalotiopsis fici (strain W106-1 / CGMCC3.15140) TaxID=1229662 RepID=W3WLP3_PESFW|nr:uncharacterized protein PFICI_13314 [Pestalotiopsis fici W106-1]ETS74830.1 hypothetical protein PFICI_13314 [Pestalotiopsis fici W106-1]